jgi:hypothetical protein
MDKPTILPYLKEALDSPDTIITIGDIERIRRVGTDNEIDIFAVNITVPVKVPRQ